jgi:Ca2+-binding RTX toxin-like protein
MPGTTPPKTPLGEDKLTAVTGGVGDERISGTSANNLYETGYGNDTVLAWTGNDTVRAGADNDHVSGQDGNDSIDGGDGTDIVLGGAGQDTVTGGAGSDMIVGGTGADLLNGDALLGVQGDDQFRWNPGDGNDTINGGGGTDLLIIEDTSISLQALLNGLQRDSGSAAPRMMNGYIDVTGFSGTLTINNETIRFSGLEKLLTGADMSFLGR